MKQTLALKLGQQLTMTPQLQQAIKLLQLSALDLQAEIQDALYAFMEGKTVIAIAHRLSTIQQMDRIVVLDEGRVVEEGDHGQLLACNGLYARFGNRQSGGLIGTSSE